MRAASEMSTSGAALTGADVREHHGQLRIHGQPRLAARAGDFDGGAGFAMPLLYARARRRKRDNASGLESRWRELGRLRRLGD